MKVKYEAEISGCFECPMLQESHDGVLFCGFDNIDGYKERVKYPRDVRPCPIEIK